MAAMRWLGNTIFRHIHTHNLIYNTCWEDPRIDRAALELSEDDEMLVITSAGCNVLDYLLEGPRHIYAVDMNPRQNAVLELKLAGIRALDHPDFFRLFGRGSLEGVDGVYADRLRPLISPDARLFWDRHLHYFSTEREKNSYYFHGTTGLIARLVNRYLDCKRGLRDGVMEMFDAPDIGRQQELYYGWIRDAVWTPLVRRAICSDVSLWLAGVPKAQRDQVERNYERGVAQLLEECLEAVFARLPLGDNYFWRVYVTGHYTEACCPEYLKEENFLRLKDGLADRVSVFTDSVEGFLRKHPARLSRFVLLDHMDWLASHRQDWLQQEWQAIVDRAAPNARVLFRSGGLTVDYVDPLVVKLPGGTCRMGELLHYDRPLAESLHQLDRVHMYGSFHVADLVCA